MRRLFAGPSYLDASLFILLVFSVILMTIDHRTPYLDKLHAAMAMVKAPLYRWIDTPAWLWEQCRASLSDRHRLSEENAQLRIQQLRLQAQVNVLSAAKHTGEQIQKILDRVSVELPERSLAARLLHLHLSPFAQRRFIDRGRTSGVYRGQPVIDAGGVVGQVVSVGTAMSEVLLLTDVRSAIPVQVQRNGVQAIVMGSGAPERLQLLHISDTLDVRVGDHLLTSGMGARYPMGYPVGVITSVEHRTVDRFVTVQVRPSAHLTKSTQVLLLWPKHHESVASQPITMDAH